MADSDGAWGTLMESDPTMADTWDTFLPLPEPGANGALDALVASKNITIGDLVRVGARLTENGALAFAYPAAIKFRDVVTGKRWNYIGSEFPAPKIIKAAVSSDTVVICEGETDAAWLSSRVDCDVAMLGAGAKTFTEDYATALDGYARVLVGLDNDDAGEAGWSKIHKLIDTAVRWRPEGNDWCEGTERPVMPDPSLDPAPLNVFVNARDLLKLEVPEHASWFEHDILPIGGLMILHGWAKSFKTFIAMDMLARIATGKDWCCFEPREEPTRVGVIQYEVAWPYYNKRIQALMSATSEPDLFGENFCTYAPLSRPQLQAGNTKSEDKMLKSLTDAGIQVVLFDPIRRMMGALDFNSEADTRKVLGFFARLQDEGLTVIATHHDNKEFAKYGGGDPRGMTGSGSFTGDPDTLVSVSLPRGDRLNDSVRRNISFTLRNSPATGTRGMEMREDGSIIYSLVAHGPDDEADTTANSSTSEMPSI